MWRALTRPAAAARWLPSHAGWLEAPPDALAANESLRFRARMQRLPVSGEIRMLELAPGRVRARIRVGLFGFEARFSLRPERGAPGATHVGLVLTLANEVALVGGSLDRFAARELASELAERTLAALGVAAGDGEAEARGA